MWQGDFTPKPEGAVREKLLAQEAELIKQIKELNAKPLPRGDKEQMARFRKLDLLELASKLQKIQVKLGRAAGVKMLRV
jgi:hypothetical protein